MQIQENFPLRPYNTFGIDAKARHFSSFSSAEELEELLSIQSKQLSGSSNLPPLVLGGGSNILFSKDYDGLVLKNNIPGMEELTEDEEYVYVRAGAGENWHQFVKYCLGRDWAGLENLSLIPGNVGAAPIQNIGAYGVELAEVFWNLEAFHLQEKKIYTLTETDCEFGYRDSSFKNKNKGRFVILSVCFRLRKDPIFHTSYGSLHEELDRMGIKELTIQAISQAVINIRSSKLPDPAVIGNAGSFFKNPTVSIAEFEDLKEKFPGIVGHETLSGSVKLAAAWMIEQCGWKGYRRGDAGCHEKQALVLVNYGNASGAEILALSEEIQQSVFKKFGITLEREVNIV